MRPLIPLVAVAIAAAVIGGFIAWPLARQPEGVPLPEIVKIPAGSHAYRPAGQYLMGNRVVDPALRRITHNRALRVMKFPVTQQAYADCVAHGACAPTVVKSGASLPQTNVSFDDAVAYAAWYSEQTGVAWRLPSDAEWAFVAASRFRDDALGVGRETANPADRWLAQYAAETEGQGDADPVLRPIGSTAPNEHGIADLAGNVWEWTETCYERVTLADDGQTIIQARENCGVRVAEGRHRAYITTFVRDARLGGCSAGLPPDYLGFRLVRDDGPAAG